MIGVGYRLAQMRRRVPTVECERCGMSYPQSRETCPYCDGLDGAALQAVQEKVRMRKRRTAGIGRTFLLIALVLMLVMAALLL